MTHGTIKLKSNKQFLHHVRVAHSNSKIFQCSKNDCQRSYFTYSCFAKHRHTKHNDCVIETVNPLTSSTELQQPAAILYAEDKTCSTDTNENICEFNSFSEIDSDSDDENGAFEFNELVVFCPPIGPMHTDLDSTEAFSQLLQFEGSLLSAELYNYHDVTRKRIQNIQNHVTKFLNIRAVPILENNKINRSKCLGGNSDELTHGERDDNRAVKGMQVHQKIPVQLTFIALTQVLTRFFELPHILHNTCEYMKELYSNSIVVSNSIKKEFWKNKLQHFRDKFLLPIFLYFDDYETNNPLCIHT